MRKSILSIGAHVHTHVQGTFIPAHTKADRLHNSTKIKLRSVLPDFTSLFILSKVPHDCPTPHVPTSYPTKAPPLSSFQTCPQAGQKGTYATEHARLSQHTAPPTWKCGFPTAQRKMPGLAVNPNRLSWEITIPKPTEQSSSSGLVQEMGVRGGKGFLISQRNSTNTLYAIGSSPRYHTNLNSGGQQKRFPIHKDGSKQLVGESINISQQLLDQFSCFFDPVRTTWSLFWKRRTHTMSSIQLQGVRIPS